MGASAHWNRRLKAWVPGEGVLEAAIDHAARHLNRAPFAGGSPRELVRRNYPRLEMHAAVVVEEAPMSLQRNRVDPFEVQRYLGGS